MRIVRKGESPVQQGTTFTGHVTQDRLIAAQDQAGVSVSLVSFQDGARTHWHEHPGEQILVIVEGKGRVGDEEQEFTLEPGDVVHTGPGERHWHGAAPGFDMKHLSITTVGSPTWYEPPEE